MPNQHLFYPGRSIVMQRPNATVRIGFLSEDRLHISVDDGPHAGFADSVSYQMDRLAGDITILSWRGRIGTSVVIAIDRNLDARAYVSSSGEIFSRFSGTIRPERPPPAIAGR